MSKPKSKKEQHPLYNSWSWMKRMSVKHELSPDWKDFEKFISDMGEKPGVNFQIYRVDKTLGYSKENCVWKEVTPSKDKAFYMREYRRKDPSRFKGYDLKRRLNFSVRELEVLNEAQEGVCAICGKEESVLVNGIPRSLAVDHNHTTGEIRGLLCSMCNRGLGYFKDSNILLQKAVNYLVGV
jgi:hypothetical protein